MSKIKNWSRIARGSWHNEVTGKTLHIVERPVKGFETYQVQYAGELLKPMNRFASFGKAREYALGWMKDHPTPSIIGKTGLEDISTQRLIEMKKTLMQMPKTVMYNPQSRENFQRICNEIEKRGYRTERV